ncbi:UDP-N-acetylmuramoylalanyl-D-glutamate--2,6-diaminopimelate ligase [Paucidesulfovibrio gracilis DSM 16080]|uniref:UDP-N-acetylmuramoyl-L-alanyl-D-glutamate--2,6-diaminopimelate ligase n=1 Tax=Paucidesulfovibrio gracilis DSM 16080 TaxID=1121449 RepID=A0A1T4W5P4_9BACT|nr:UDP-N-acetylmuramoyl-L-alanyl-D-glutamate--2,6-diaminopimelate ligase [Paucidesulfovibrio gracilis]SKA72368.1 UDP-N-acetylmuramoylalanyl-D-glutamate--2,6-diaminopimelate ligase [Paucidesulfovibrio gracilis DSM 16080]
MSQPNQPTWTELLALAADGLRVRTDSRKVLPGEVFVALPGSSVDGTRFIPDALQNGAKYIVTQQEGTWTHGTDAALLVRPDAAEALGQLARAHFHADNQRLRLVGITGTNGKTTTAFIIEHLLSAVGLKAGLMGTVAYRWPGFSLDATLTTPDCWTLHELICNMAHSDVDAVVMEASSHAIEQKRVAGLEFDVTVLTNVTQDHLDYHGDMEHYFNAKAALFRERPNKDKVWVLNYDDPYGRRLLPEAHNALAYGLGPAPEDTDALHGEVLSSTASGLHMRMHHQGNQWEMHSKLIGKHNALNLLAAQAVGLCLGLSPRDMRKLEAFHGVPGRLERVPNDQGLDIFVDYAHTPDALINVLTALREITEGRLLALFGCGGNRDRTKRPLMAEAVAKHADVGILTSDNPRHEDPVRIMDDAWPGLANCHLALREVDRYAAMERAVAMMQPGDVLLVAGKGHETYQQVGDEKLPFSDVESVAKAIQEVLG